MSSRDKILEAVRNNQPDLVSLPGEFSSRQHDDAATKFQQVLESIGGSVYMIRSGDVAEKVLEIFPAAKRIVSSISSVEQYFLKEHRELMHHSLADVDIAILSSNLGVAENGAVWVTEDDAKIRVLPFIPEHLVVVLKRENIVPTMLEAYDRINAADNYDFGVFIAGPSKTADIEQSLVLGAHGPKSMTIFLTND